MYEGKVGSDRRTVLGVLKNSSEVIACVVLCVVLPGKKSADTYEKHCTVLQTD